MNRNAPCSRISIFFSVNADSPGKYFNENDPAPLYCRRLSHGFQAYLDSAIVTAKRHTIIDYKVCCSDAVNMRFLVDPLEADRPAHLLLEPIPERDRGHQQNEESESNRHRK